MGQCCLQLICVNQIFLSGKFFVAFFCLFQLDPTCAKYCSLSSCFSASSFIARNLLWRSWFFKELKPQQTMHLEIGLHLSKGLSFPCKSLSQPTLVVQIRLQCCFKLRNLNLQRILCCLEQMIIVIVVVVVVVVICYTLDHIPCISVLSPCQMQSSEVSRCFPFMKNRMIWYIVVVHSHLRITLSFSKSLIFSLAWCRDCL